MFSVEWDIQAQNDLKALPENISSRIIEKVERHLVHYPQKLGRKMTGGYSGCYHYRIGDYRVIYQIIEKEIRIIVVHVGHRKDVYE